VVYSISKQLLNLSAKTDLEEYRKLERLKKVRNNIIHEGKVATRRESTKFLNINATPLGECMSELDIKLQTFMVDPSVLTSKEHVYELPQLSHERRIFVPATLVAAIRDNVVDEVLRYFAWPRVYYHIPKPSPECLEIIMGLARYQYERENVEEIIYPLERLALPRNVKDILLEEYSFLKRHSALLLRFRRTIQHFKNLGVSTIDVTNKLKDHKENIFGGVGFGRVKGLRWIVAFLLNAAGCLAQEPLWSIIGISNFILAVFDP